MLGSGRQARPQLIALLRAAPSIEHARVYSPNADHRRQYAAEMSARAGIPVEAVDDPRRAVEGADVIGICSNSRQPVLEASWVRPGAFIVSISGGQLPNDLITSSRVTVCTREDVVGPDAKREPYTSMIASGEWAADRVAAEMSEIILGKIPGRVSDDETVVHEMPGVSFWDTAIVNLAYRWAVTHEVGTPFNLSSPA
jgi:ornithine cyclodeaminase/alanine dehydrogenase-like protein (mu-crystallin family)